MHMQGVLCLCLEPQALGLQLSAFFRVQLNTDKLTAIVEHSRLL
jgi:hypothetical protein